FIKRLSEKFKVRIYRFSKEAERLDSLAHLTFDGKQTRIEAVTQLLHEELSTVPLSGMVLITDDADNDSEQLSDSLARLETRKIPFYTIGMGSSEIVNDTEILKVSAPREMLKESTAVVNVSFRSHSFAGKHNVIKMMESGPNEGLVASPDITFRS